MRISDWSSDVCSSDLLPGPVKTIATILGGLAGTASLAAGGFLLLAPRIKDASEILSRLAKSSPAAATGLSKLSTVGKHAAGFAVLKAGVVALTAALSDAGMVKR